MRVLMITGKLPGPADPGSMAPVMRQIQSLGNAGVQVDVMEITGPRGFKYVHAMTQLPRSMASVDLIHAHFGYSGWVGRCQVSRPLVVSFMGDDLLGTPDESGRPSFPSRMVVEVNRLFARTVSAVIVKSEEMARVVAPVKAHVVPNGVNLDSFVPMDRDEARRLLGWDLAKHIVLFPGSPHIPRKGYSMARAACSRAAHHSANGMELAVLWGVPPHRVPLVMNGCDAMLLTSYWEGSPNVVKEAMACNLPVVSVPVGDVSRLLDGVSDSAVCVRDEDALAGKLTEILRARRRTNGRTALRQKGLDQESVARRIKGVYEEVMREGKACECLF